MGSPVVSTAPLGVPPTNWQHSPWRSKRWAESAAPPVRRDAEQNDRDLPAPILRQAGGRAPLFRLHRWLRAREFYETQICRAWHSIVLHLFNHSGAITARRSDSRESLSSGIDHATPVGH